MGDNFRATFTKMLQTTVKSAVEHEDQVRGRQLATMFEKASIVLRHHFGGRSVWQMERRKRPGREEKT